MRTAVLYGSPKTPRGTNLENLLHVPPHPASPERKERAQKRESNKLLRKIWSRNRLRNLSEDVSRAFFNADSEYAIGFL